MTAREAAVVAETVYYSITKFYDYEPQEKTHLILIDPDDYSNGAAYYYDNKIMIWISKYLNQLSYSRHKCTSLACRGDSSIYV